jgi:hypothetical protein
MNNREIRLLGAIETAYRDAARGKKSWTSVKNFARTADAELEGLAREIHSRTYRPRPSTAFIVRDPVMREIFAADFRDRIVHHLLFNIVNSWWDARFIRDSYSCRRGKGTLDGIRRLDAHIRQASSNYKKPVYVLKLDIAGYFMNLSRKKLYDRALWGLNRQFPNGGYVYQVAKFLWKTIIFNDPLENVVRKGRRRDWDGLPPNKSLFRQPPGRGIAIGNLTSQLLSNIYLDQLDRFVTLELGFKHYGRYVDDFYLVDPSREKLKRTVPVIEKYLRNELKLRLHPKKRCLQDARRGVAFIGAVVYPYRIQPGKRLKSHLVAALKNPSCAPETRASYEGLVRHYKHKKLLRKANTY